MSSSEAKSLTIKLLVQVTWSIQSFLSDILKSQAALLQDISLQHVFSKALLLNGFKIKAKKNNDINKLILNIRKPYVCKYKKLLIN